MSARVGARCGARRPRTPPPPSPSHSRFCCVSFTPVCISLYLHERSGGREMRRVPPAHPAAAVTVALTLLLRLIHAIFSHQSSVHEYLIIKQYALDTKANWSNFVYLNIAEGAARGVRRRVEIDRTVCSQTTHNSAKGSMGPSIPENITVTFLNPTTVRVSWSTTAELVEKYDVTYKPSDAR
ncbi:Fibronectin type III domain-containing protein 5 [Operophtera brumata]|uniref:Fibronectin type III domain-containing protein 5 n=1 Tax=Operophtera brumata TaxID=104452 RepID=A0A0L7LAF1_OPEBR|nr:Fibronectin type III domain-containing protein 5 [Operophtera brumata]